MTQKHRKNKVIRASGIGQYHYCSIGWYLQRKGYVPRSPKLSEGKKEHFQLGETISYMQKNKKKVSSFTILSYVLLLIGLFLLFVGWLV